MRAAPHSTWEMLERVPPDRALILLLRHAHREEVADGLPGDEVPLTDEGRERARLLGERLGARLCTLRTSPVLRCVQTANALAFGAGVAVPVVEDRLLGGPGVYVEDGEEAGRTWRQLGHGQVMARLIAGERLPGMADPITATRHLAAHLHEVAGGRSGVHVFATHDSVVAPAAAHLLGRTLETADWPGYLEGVALVQDGAGATTVFFRGWTRTV